MARLAGKKALITGGAGGLGSAIARRFVQEGAQVVLADLDLERAERIAETLREETSGASVTALVLDVTSEAAWIDGVARADETMGGLSVLVHNAGILTRGNVETLDYEAWQQAMRVNVDSVFLGTKHALPKLRLNQPGSIVVVSSISGIIASHDMPAYNTSKAGAWMLSKSIALHCARQGLDVRCNSVHPTFIDTAMLDDFRGALGREDADAKLARQVPLRRLGQPVEVADAVLYLASDESRYVTGAELKIDGGISAM